jgi:hypothetical protein
MSQAQRAQPIHVEFFLEEQSAEEALRQIVPKIVGPGVTYRFHAYSGKRDLLGKLPQRLRAYARFISPNERIVVLVDRDNDECGVLKEQLEQFARDAGLTTKSSVSGAMPFQVLNRLAIEELEAWFFGDVEALRSVYPRLDPNLSHNARYRDPDAIKGGTCEALERELRRMGYHPGGLPKISVARNVSAAMEPERNKSASFQIFRQGLLATIGA